MKSRDKELDKIFASLGGVLPYLDLDKKTLSGLLPICANCKSIRDDKGYWSRVESYIAARVDVEFSRGICPGCLKKLYGFDPDEKSKEGAAKEPQ
jgi:hypothetical protein